VAVPAAPETTAPAVEEGWVTCRVGPGLESWPEAMIVLPRDQAAMAVVPWRLEGDWLQFGPVEAEGSATLAWARGPRGRAPIRWKDGVCDAPTLPPVRDAAVYGRVRGAERLDDGTVFLEGCGIDQGDESAPIDQDGGFFFPAASEPCRVRAWRQHGALRLPGPWIELDPTAGADLDVELEVPTFAPAGMGIGFRPAAEGVVVEQVHAGTPAFEAGLQSGDVISAINGVPTDGMGMEDFLHEGIGPAGTEVQVEGVTADGEPFDTTFQRREIVLDRG